MEPIIMETTYINGPEVEVLAIFSNGKALVLTHRNVLTTYPIEKLKVTNREKVRGYVRQLLRDQIGSQADPSVLSVVLG